MAVVTAVRSKVMVAEEVMVALSKVTEAVEGTTTREDMEVHREVTVVRRVVMGVRASTIITTTMAVEGEVTEVKY